MTEPSFVEELTHLKDLAREFAAVHPALAPMLGGPSSDPDVERILDGIAFQSALLRRQLEANFPMLIQDLAGLVCPQFLRPVPATTIVAFSPDHSLTESETVAAGAELVSIPIDGTRCRFRTCSPVEVQPLELLDAALAQPPGQAPAVELTFCWKGTSLANWSPRALRLFLADDFLAAADLYLLLRRYLSRIVVTPVTGGRPVDLPADCLQAVDLADEEVIPFPSQAFPGFRILQEFFTIPQRFLFLDLYGWERWTERGSGSRFSVRFELSCFPLAAPRVKRESFALFAASAVNLFSHDATPVLLDHRSYSYPVRPDGLAPGHADIFSIDSVTGFVPGEGSERSYRPLELFHGQAANGQVYHCTLKSSPLPGRSEVRLSVGCHAPEEPFEAETLSIQLTCTNGTLPGGLRVGDLRGAAGFPADCGAFRNIVPVTGGAVPELGEPFLSKLVSHLSLSNRPIDSAQALRDLLGLYLFEEGGDPARLVADRRRIGSIEEIATVPARMLLDGVPLRGMHIRLKVSGDHFAGAGDLFLFGSVLDEFFAGSATLNTFTRLSIHDLTTGETMQWQPRLGQQILS